MHNLTCHCTGYGKYAIQNSASNPDELAEKNERDKVIGLKTLRVRTAPTTQSIPIHAHMDEGDPSIPLMC